MVTHDAGAAAVGDRVLFLADGRSSTTRPGLSVEEILDRLKAPAMTRCRAPQPRGAQAADGADRDRGPARRGDGRRHAASRPTRSPTPSTTSPQQSVAKIDVIVTPERGVHGAASAPSRRHARRAARATDPARSPGVAAAQRRADGLRADRRRRRAGRDLRRSRSRRRRRRASASTRPTIVDGHDPERPGRGDDPGRERRGQRDRDRRRDRGRHPPRREAGHGRRAPSSSARAAPRSAARPWSS